ncbi:hypothetical protein [Jannaschia ovalis]|uniref:Flp pilus assembly protein, pilin Flp n=1 Tax=Jannaschia ovalis TaxID=3038773 RepID=A0ABY8LA02_9RHOB|nr:hypothetical protein [Jannaschia sp. GRR-S6-38]WGH77956.1 hypothetical protein P8627_13075 [Jannaschia sp. GRR-S6-38]
MSVFTPHLRRFRADQRGAISVDYVVITALAMGVAVAASEEIMSGMGFLAATVDSELSGSEVDSGTMLSYRDGFDNGAGDWLGAEATEVFGVGKVLGPIPGSNGEISVSRSFAIDPSAEYAELSFDLLAFDGLQGESGYVYVNGQAVGYVTSLLGETVITPIETAGIQLTGAVIDNAVELGGASINREDSLDSRSSLQIRVADPGAELVFGFGSDAAGDVNTGSFALDNFRVTGLLDPDAATVAQVPVDNGQTGTNG